MPKTLKIVSWNVNGIRAAIRNGMLDFMSKQKPDIICLQEIKISNSARAKEQFDFADYKEFWFSAEKPGYAGTAILVKNKYTQLVISQNNGVGINKFDQEGRIQTLELPSFFLVNTYFPHSRHDLSRLNYKLEFNKAWMKLVLKLSNKKHVVTTGDFNVAHAQMDLANPNENEGNPGFHPKERQWMTKFLSKGYIDVFRYFNPTKIQYTWWSYKFNVRARNIGWRIDYFCVSKLLKKKIMKTEILDKIKGSDHCPILLKINL